MESGKIEENSENSTAAVEMSPYLRFINIFYSPKEVFASLKGKKWAWILPIILVFASMMITSPLIKEIKADEQTRWIENSRLIESLPESQKQQIIDDARESTLNPSILSHFSTLAVIAVLVLAFGGIYLLIGNIILGGAAKYYDMLNVCSFSLLILIPSEIVKTPLILAKETMDIRTSLALILPADAIMTFSHTFLSMFDVFLIWLVAVAVIGMSVALPNVSIKKIAVWLSVLWVLIALVLGLLVGLISG